MKIFTILLINILSLFFFIDVSSQINYSQTDSIYGLDPILYNGQYNPNIQSLNIEGHPFLFETDFNSGTITIHNKIYENVLLNYDIYNQLLLLKYKNTFGADCVINLSKAWIKKFTIHNTCFELINISEFDKRIYQVIGKDSIKILYYWNKSLSLSASSNNNNNKYFFSKPEKEMYIYKDGSISKFNNNKSFVKLFESQNQSIIKKHLKNNKISIKKSSESIVLNIITYCNKLKN